MLEDVEAGAKSEVLLRTVVGAIIELRKAAYLATVSTTDYPDEGDSGAEEGEEEEEEATVMTEKGDEMVVEVMEGGEDEVVVEGEEEAVIAAGLELAENFLGTWRMDLAE